MSLIDRIRRLVTEPPPAYLFEVSPLGIAYGSDGNTGFRPLPEGVLSVSPLNDNITQSDAFLAEVAEAFPASNGSAAKHRPAAVILPDYASRLQVLDFDTFPAKPEEQQALVRFRMKKTVPFDIETAAVNFYAQPAAGDAKKTEVVAALMSYEILGRYEAIFREAGYQPGVVTTSSLAALNLIRSNELALVAKLSGKTLTMLVLDGGRLRMARCLEPENLSEEDVLAAIYPTLAYMEDVFAGKSSKGRPQRIWLCGFGPDSAELAQRWTDELKVPVEVLTSRYGTPGPHNAGMLGFMEGAN
jgi:type IV pilus assembly protein PilM